MAGISYQELERAYDAKCAEVARLNAELDQREAGDLLIIARLQRRRERSSPMSLLSSTASS